MRSWPIPAIPSVQSLSKGHMGLMKPSGQGKSCLKLDRNDVVCATDKNTGTVDLSSGMHCQKFSQNSDKIKYDVCFNGTTVVGEKSCNPPEQQEHRRINVSKFVPSLKHNNVVQELTKVQPKFRLVCNATSKTSGTQVTERPDAARSQTIIISPYDRERSELKAIVKHRSMICNDKQPTECISLSRDTHNVINNNRE